VCNDAYLPDDEQSEEEYSEHLHEEWAHEQERLAAQDALPPHKRDGYAEKMYDMADMIRKSKREQGL
jgi:hypothetical protein